MAKEQPADKGTREYKQWSKVEEEMLVICMRELVDGKHVDKGNFKLSDLKALERMMHSRLPNYPVAVPHIKSKVRYMKNKFAASLELKNASGFGWDEARGCVVADDDVFTGWVKSHPKASGLNNKPLPHWDDLCVIFGADMATGEDAVQPGDAASRVQSRAACSDFMKISTEQVDSYTIPSNMDRNSVMEDLINQGIDMHATGLKEVEAEISSKHTPVKGKGARSTSTGSKRSRQSWSEEQRDSIASCMAATSEHISKIATSYCIETELALKRQCLYEELSNFPELSSYQRTKAMRHLYRDDGDASTYFHLRTPEEKLAFVWTILE
ncbi:hypothetical protein LINPERPRIM_LOCUS14506 [Linum perenne]